MDYKSTILILPWSPVTVKNQPSYGGPTLRPWAPAASPARKAPRVAAKNLQRHGEWKHTAPAGAERKGGLVRIG